MKKRIVSAFLALVMVVSVVSTTGVQVKAAISSDDYGINHDSTYDNPCGLIPYAYFSQKFNSLQYFVAHYNINRTYNAAELERSFNNSVTTSIFEGRSLYERLQQAEIVAINQLFGFDGELTGQDLYDNLLVSMLLDQAVTKSETAEVKEEYTQDINDLISIGVEVFESGSAVNMELFSFLKTLGGDVPAFLSALQTGYLNTVTDMGDAFGKTIVIAYGNKTVRLDGGILDKALQKATDGKCTANSLSKLFMIISWIIDFADESGEFVRNCTNAYLIWKSVDIGALDFLKEMRKYTGDHLLLNTAMDKYIGLIEDDSIFGLVETYCQNYAEYTTELSMNMLTTCFKATVLAVNLPYAVGSLGYSLMELAGFGFAEKAESVHIINALNTVDAAVINAMNSIEKQCVDNYLDPESVALCDAYVNGMIMAWRLQSKELEYAKEYMTAWYGESAFADYFGESDAWDNWLEGIESMQRVLSDVKPSYFYNNAYEMYGIYIDIVNEGQTVKYDLNGGTGTIPDQKKDYYGSIQLTTIVPQKEGYAFAGWAVEGHQLYRYSSGEAFGHILKGTTLALEPCICDNEVVLIALWNDQDTISYNANGGTNAPDSHENTDGTTTLSAQVPTRANYNFLGWATSATAGAAEYAAGGELDLEGDVTLYAVWEPVTFNIIFDANGGQFDEVGTTQISKPKQYNRPFSIDVATPYGKTGYKFAGMWAINQDGSGSTYTHGTTVSDIGDPSSNDKTLYAVWLDAMVDVLYDYGDDPTGSNVTTVTESYDTSAGAVTYTVKEPEEKSTYNGNSFKGWICQDPNGTYWWATPYADNGMCTMYQPGDQITLSNDLVLYAKWLYLVHYDHGNSQYTHVEVGDNTVYTVTEPAYTQEGHIFKCWQYVDESGATVTCVPGDQISLTGDLYLTAVWEVSSYLRSGSVQDATGNPIEGVVVEFLDADGISVGTAVTDNEGCYSFSFSQYGTYTQTFTKDGYQAATDISAVVNEQVGSLGVIVLEVLEQDGDTENDDTENDDGSEKDEPTVIASGTCGTDLVWELNDAGMLAISGTGAMSGYAATTMPWYEYKDQITSVVIGDEVTGIGAYSFFGHDGITQVSLGRMIASVGNYAFQNCSKLTTITVPDNITSISARGTTQFPFKNTAITTIVVPKTVASLSEQLYNMDTVAVFEAEGDNGYGYFDEDGILYHKELQTGKQTLVKCPQSKVLTGTYTVLEGTSTIGAYAFYDKDRLENVALPETLTSIGVYAFWDCDLLQTVHIPDAVTSVAQYSFLGCDSIDDVYLGRSLTTLGNCAFQDCGSLRTITVPDNLTAVSGRLSTSFQFQNTAITTIVVPKTVTSLSEQLYNMDTVAVIQAEGNEGYGYFEDNGILYYKDVQTNKQTLVKCPQSKVLTGTYTVLEGTNTIGSQAFYNKDRLENVVMPESLTKIGERAFYDCDLLETVHIPDAVTIIGYDAFYGCAILDDVYLGRKLSSIAQNAFAYCETLATITIPDATSVYGDSANTEYSFYSCPITTIIVPKTVTAIPAGLYNMDTITAFEAEGDSGYGYFDVGGILYYKDAQTDTQTLVKCPQSMILADTYTVLDGTNVIGAHAFYNKDRLTNVVLPESLTAIEGRAFYDCDMLETIRVPDAVTYINYYAFYGCDALDNVHLGASLKSISGSAFANCGSLTNVYFYGAAPSLGSSAFASTAAGFAIYYLETQTGWTTPTWGGYSAYPFALEGTAGEYQINSISLKAVDGTEMTSIPKAAFQATVSITNRSVEHGDTVVLLAAYTSQGQFRGLMSIAVEGCPIGATVKVTLPVENADGDIAELRAFTVSASGEMVPLGDAVVFPA